MSNIYNYDLLISCAPEDEGSAHLLSRKLRELDFHVWFGMPKVEEDEFFIERFRKAVETSAACVLLLGVDVKVPWADKSGWLAIRSKLQRMHGTFRVIAVTLPGVSADSAGWFTSLIEPQLVNYGRRWSVIRFKESLDEEDAIHELILRIRGVEPTDQSDWFQESFRKVLCSRAQNALSVDWHKLASDLYSTSCETFEERDGVAAATNEASIGEGVEDTWGWKHNRQTRSAHISKFKRHQYALPAPQLVVQEESTSLASSQRDYWIRRSLQRSGHPWEASPLFHATRWNKAGAAQLVAATLVLLLTIPGFLGWIALNSNEKGNSPTKARTNVEAAPIASSALNNPEDVHTDSKLHGEMKPSNVRSTNHVRPRPSLTKRDRVARAATRRTPATPPISPAAAPSDGGEMVKKSDPEESHLSEIPKRWEKQYLKTLAGIRMIYVNLEGIDLDRHSRASVIAGFTNKLKKKGIRVSTKKEDKNHADGIAELQFGRNEMESGSVSVDLLDKKNNYINSWDTSAGCKQPGSKEPHVGLCEASQRLADKLGRAILAARANVGKQDHS